MKLADSIVITRLGSDAVLTIDGEEFPWHVSEAGVRASVNRNDVPAITVTILANTVEVVNSIDPEPIAVWQAESQAKADRP